MEESLYIHVGTQSSGKGISLPTSETPQAIGGSRFGGNSVGRLHSEAFNRFRQADTRGAAGIGGTGQGTPSYHANGGEWAAVDQNTIMRMERSSKFTPSGGMTDWRFGRCRMGLSILGDGVRKG